MQITTKDKTTVTIATRTEPTPDEVRQWKEMEFRRLYHVGNVCGFEEELHARNH